MFSYFISCFYFSYLFHSAGSSERGADSLYSETDRTGSGLHCVRRTGGFPGGVPGNDSDRCLYADHSPCPVAYECVQQQNDLSGCAGYPERGLPQDRDSASEIH